MKRENGCNKDEKKESRIDNIVSFHYNDMYKEDEDMKIGKGIDSYMGEYCNDLEKIVIFSKT